MFAIEVVIVCVQSPARINKVRQTSPISSPHKGNSVGLTLAEEDRHEVGPWHGQREALAYNVQKGALSTAEVCESLGLSQMKGRRWHVQAAVAIRGEGLYEGLDWCAACS